MTRSNTAEARHGLVQAELPALHGSQLEPLVMARRLLNVIGFPPFNCRINSGLMNSKTHGFPSLHRACLIGVKGIF